MSDTPVPSANGPPALKKKPGFRFDTASSPRS